MGTSPIVGMFAPDESNLVALVERLKTRARAGVAAECVVVGADWPRAIEHIGREAPWVSPVALVRTMEQAKCLLSAGVGVFGVVLVDEAPVELPPRRNPLGYVAAEWKTPITIGDLFDSGLDLGPLNARTAAWVQSDAADDVRLVTDNLALALAGPPPGGFRIVAAILGYPGGAQALARGGFVDLLCHVNEDVPARAGIPSRSYLPSASPSFS